MMKILRCRTFKLRDRPLLACPLERKVIRLLGEL